MTTATRDERLLSILHGYLQAVDRGEKPDRQAILDAHPDLRADLANYFGDASKLDGLARSMKTSPHLTAERPEPRTIRYFGDYEVLGEIARGGMGVVYRARQVSLNRIVALKMILAGELATEKDALRFRAEAEAAGGLDHPHIVSIYEVGVHQGQNYFSMKLIEGGSLSQHFPALMKDPRRAAAVLAKVARAVHFAHQRGILHRDLKPANILLDDRGEPHVTDFGLAKRVKQTSDLTGSGTIVGTPSYMAPEQALARKDISTLADVYSLGAILYQLLAGQPPFVGENPMEVLLRVVEKEPTPPGKIAAHPVNADLETIALKCLAKEPERRFPSAEAFAEELERWLRGEPILARPVGPIERLRLWRRRNPVVAALTASVACLLVVGTIVSSFFAIQARQQADEATRQQKKAEDNFAFAQTEQKRAEDNFAIAQTEQKRADANARLADEKAQAALKSAEESAAAKTLAEQNLYVANMNLAQQAFDLGQSPRTLELLRKHVPSADGVDPRGFEWHHLEYLAKQYTGVLEHPTRVATVAYSPDGNLIATGGNDNVLRFWDARTAALVSSHPINNKSFSRVRFSPDRIHLAFTAFPNTVEVWDVPKKTRVAATTVKPFGRCVEFSPDGKTIALSSDDPVIELWEWAGKKRIPLKGHSKSVRGLAYSKDGTLLASCGLDGTINVWDLKTNTALATMQGWEASAIAISPDNKTVAVGADKGQLVLWDIAAKKQLRHLQGHTIVVQQVLFTDDGKLLYSAGADRKVMLWNVETGKAVSTLNGHDHWIYDLALSPDGKTIASAGLDNTVKLWDAARAAAPDKQLLSGHKGYVHCAFSADSTLLVTGGADKEDKADKKVVRIWDVRTGETVKKLSGFALAINDVAFAPDGKSVAAAGGAWSVPRELKVWNLQTDEMKDLTTRHTRYIRCVHFSPDGRWLATGGEDFGIEIWDAKTLTSRHYVKDKTDYIFNMAFSPDGNILVTGSGEIPQREGLVFWDTATGACLGVLKGHTGTVYGLSFSKDGGTLATSGQDRTIRLWDVATRKEIKVMTGHTDGVVSVALAPDGRTLASSSRDGTVKLWNLATGQPAATFKYEANIPGQVAFSPDGAMLAGCYQDGSIRLWRTK